MAWTEQVPTEVGYYWWRGSQDRRPEIVAFTEFSDWVHLDLHGRVSYGANRGEFWDQPLYPPVNSLPLVSR